MATLGPQIVTGSYGNLLKFLPTGEDGVTTLQVQITDGKGKVTPLHLATGSVYVSGTLSSSAEVVFSGLTQATQTNIVCIDGSGRLYFQNSASFQDNDWTVGSSYMTASGQTSVYIPNKLEQGNNNVASGFYSHAQGEQNLALGDHSHAEGIFNTSSGIQSHVEGTNNVSFGAMSHAEGVFTFASGNASHTEGQGTLAIGNVSHAEGYYTTASGKGSHTEGEYTRTDVLADYAHAEGQYTLASQDYAHAEGQYTTASGVGSHAEGYYTRATSGISHAEGGFTWAQGGASHAEGYYTTSSGLYSHAEGMETKTLPPGGGIFKWGQHAEGYRTLADKNFSHAEGMFTTASGQGSHAGGFETNAVLDNQTVVGRKNATSYFGDDTFVVGNGGGSDAFKVRTDNNEVIIAPTIRNLVSNTNPDDTTPNAFPGLYFGEPQFENTIRITRQSPNNINSLVIQENTNQSNNGSDYTNTMALFQSTVQFVAS
jgi:hypothetical protein